MNVQELIQEARRAPGKYVAFDLDGTLAQSGMGGGQIGPPIPGDALNTFQQLIRAGVPVKIITARVSPRTSSDPQGETQRIQQWLYENFGQVIPVQADKDHNMIQLFDDKAKEVEPGTGAIDEEDEEFGEKETKSYGKNNEDLPEELQNVLKELVSKYEKEDSWVRKQQIKLWKKNDEFWHGIQFIFWSESRQDWISPTETRWFQQEEGREEAEGPFYDFVVNIYKAHGEAIISALSADIPAVRFPPDDAENEDDIITSKTYAKIADLIQRHNPAKMLLLRALFIMWNQGPVFAYHASKSDKAFGKYLIPQYEKSLFCEQCNQKVSPDEDQDDMTVGQDCPQCGGPLTEKPSITGFSESPKSRVLVELYGGLHVKVPYTSRYSLQGNTEGAYIICSLDQPKAFLQSVYPHVADKIEESYSEIAQYERMARTPSAFSSFSRVDENRDLRTLKRIWLKPWVFDGLPKEKEEEKKQLKKLFPDGCYVCFVGSNDVYAESRNEDGDEYWTIGVPGLANYLHVDPIGQPLIPIQELRNVHVNLTEETVEHGIPSSYADSETLNFEVYSRHEARPGMVFPVTRKPGERIADSFYEGSRASISKELPNFTKQLDQDAQFSVGSFPSIYGGASEGKSRTASEYNQSRQMALQRLSIIWAFVVFWWSKMMEKCVRQFIKNMVEDEHFTQRDRASDNYINIWIRRSELSGHVGEVEVEGAETFPVSTPQKQQLLLQLLQLNNQFIEAAIFDPENRKEISDVLGYTDLYIPGEDQRIKQAREIQAMIKTGQVVPTEPEVDDDEIHITTTKNFLVGEHGMDLKTTNPQVYEAIKEHLMMHQQSLQQKTQGQFEETPPGMAPQVGPGA